MEWWLYLAVLIVLMQMFFTFQVYNNCRYALKKYYKKKQVGYNPKTVLIIPCKGKEPTFEENISSFFLQDYTNFLLWLVVEEASDNAYEALVKLKDKLGPLSKASDIRIFIAGKGAESSQKIHNLLYCCKRIPADTEVIAFADSDICAKEDWLRSLIAPLRISKVGATSGYRWFVPQENNTATLMLSACNAKVVEMLGNTPFNQVWGGSMAVRAEVFRNIGMEKIWLNALSDDFSLNRAVKKAGFKVRFVPQCLVASYEATTWPKLFEFARRQFIITRILTPGTWFFGVFSSLFSVLSVWGFAAVAIYATLAGYKHTMLLIAVPVIIFLCHMSRAIFRQRMAAKILSRDIIKLKVAGYMDIFFFWLSAVFLAGIIVSTAFGRTIVWRGIRYRLVSATETEVVSQSN